VPDRLPIVLPRLGSGGTLGEEAYQILKEAIVSTQLPPGTLLPEDSLVQSLGTSRTPVREALRRLYMEGLVELPPRKAPRVVFLTDRDMDAVFEAREVAETRFFVRAARSIASQEFMNIKEKLGRAESALTTAAGQPALWRQAQKEYLSLDRAFHDLLVEGCGNHYWIRFYRSLRDRIQIFAYLVSTAHPERFHVAIQEHYDILDAIIAGEFARGKALMLKHIRTFRARVNLEWLGHQTKKMEEGSPVGSPERVVAGNSK